MNPEEDVEQYIQELAEKYGQQLGNFPEPPNKETMIKFIREILNEKDPVKLTKASNLREEEVGKPRVPSLTYFNLSHYANAENYPDVAEYLAGKGGITAFVSLGRKAKLLDTMFTVRRETRNIQPVKETTQRSMFGGEKTIREGGEGT